MKRKASLGFILLFLLYLGSVYPLNPSFKNHLSLHATKHKQVNPTKKTIVIVPLYSNHSNFLLIRIFLLVNPLSHLLIGQISVGLLFPY